MIRVAWLTDIHLNFVDDAVVDRFLARVAAANADSVLIGGDIAELPTLAQYLRRLAVALPVPVYFVLGNHDFYFGSIRQTRASVEQLCQQHPNLHYLTTLTDVPLAAEVGLVGHDGWADARLGDYHGSAVMLNDYRLIEELSRTDKAGRRALLEALGDEAAEHFRQVLPPALARYRHLLLLTHVPPFHEACWHEGQLSNDEWLPHFSCRAVGDALLEIMRGHPDQELTVLCGHTHGQGEAQLLPNLQVLTGGANYGNPTIQRVFEFE